MATTAGKDSNEMSDTQALAMRCAHCDKPIKGQPTYDAEQVWWLGDKAAPYCDEVCVEEASERYWMNVWTPQ